MKWITRERPKIDRIACPWLIRRFVDPSAVFLFVAPPEVPAVADRFVRQMGPNMRYCGGVWPPCTGAGAAVYHPFAATFGDPTAANFQGVLNLTQGLPPLSFSATGPCTVSWNETFVSG